MRKVCVVLTARTSYAKIRPVLYAINSHPDLEMQLICAGSALLTRYGEMEDLITKDGFKIDERIYMIVEGENLLTSAKTTGLGLIEFASAYDRLKPDIVFIMADRYEQMAAAIPAAYMNIPIAHAQGGEVTGNIDEKVRHAITKLADIHFPATECARDFILRMGEQPEKVILSGCPSTDLCQKIIDSPEIDFKIYARYGGVGAHPVLDEDFLIVMQHPVTTEYGDALEQSMVTLKTVHELGIPTLWFWPNIDAGSDATSKAIRSYRENYSPENIHFFRNMAVEDFLRLLNKASVIIGNSSCAIREASYLGVPAVNIGSRQSDREHAENVIHSDYDQKQIKAAIERHLSQPRPQSSKLYGHGNAGEVIAQTLSECALSFHKKLSYLDSEQHTEKQSVA